MSVEEFEEIIRDYQEKKAAYERGELEVPYTEEQIQYWNDKCNA